MKALGLFYQDQVSKSLEKFGIVQNLARKSGRPEKNIEQKFFFSKKITQAYLEVFFGASLTHTSVYPYLVSIKKYEQFKLDDKSVKFGLVGATDAYYTAKDAQEKTDIQWC